MCHFRGPSVRCCLLIAINERQDFSIHSFNQEWQKVSCKSGAVMLLICWVLNYKNVCHILAAGEGRPAASRGFRWGQDYSRRLSCGMSRIIFWCVSLFIGVTLINAVNYYHKGLFILLNTHSFWVKLAQWPFKTERNWKKWIWKVKLKYTLRTVNRLRRFLSLCVIIL